MVSVGLGLVPETGGVDVHNPRGASQGHEQECIPGRTTRYCPAPGRAAS